MNIEIAQARNLRIKSSVAVKGLGLDRATLRIVGDSIQAVVMPLSKYYKADDDTIKRDFIRFVIGGIGNKLNDTVKEEIVKCLVKKL